MKKSTLSETTVEPSRLIFLTEKKAKLEQHYAVQKYMSLRREEAELRGEPPSDIEYWITKVIDQLKELCAHRPAYHRADVDDEKFVNSILQIVQELRNVIRS